jgi:hypothetical protein
MVVRVFFQDGNTAIKKRRGLTYNQDGHFLQQQRKQHQQQHD